MRPSNVGVPAEAAIRLDRALAEKVPKDASHFFRLAALQIRRERIDLARHYGGPEGMGRSNDGGVQPDRRSMQR